MDRLIGTISAEGTLQGVPSAVCNLTGKITVGKYEPEYATAADILDLFEGGTLDGD